MAPYRLDLLNDVGATHEMRVIDCEHDDDAIDRAGTIDHPHAMEIWQGERLVARFPPLPPHRPELRYRPKLN